MIQFADWTKNLSPSAMQRSLQVGDLSQYISFALGLPDESTLPSEFCSSFKFAQHNLQYSPTNHLLKTHITKIMKKRGVKCKEDEIFITSGAQQGISLLTRLLSNEGDNVLVENLSYPGFIQAAQASRINLIPILTNYNNGISLEDLTKQIRLSNKKPSFIYIVSDGSNPLGNSLTIEKRKQLIDLSLQYNIPIVEDDPYGLLYYEQNYPALKAYNNDNICYVGSFSKVIAPSLRVGWIVIPYHLINKLSILKESLDINTQTLSQKIVLEFLAQNKFESHLINIRNLYKRKRDHMINSFYTNLQDKITLYKPNNGICLWIKFHNNYAKEIFNKASEKKILFIPGSDFCVIDNIEIANDCARFNFSHCKLDDISKGIEILSNIIT
ncbi:Aromatic-amino-acid aminotransferase 1 [Rickettsiales endosymbiont of Trichoplax sp. H2]|nr:PLP-dependent aminotransferase family protein [Rickettsiales endosymbiont of Trichoplax sp. H2]MSO13391.1 Aromatic-amino-acid aminotransferase 1 [Rickettsiales endosymbiont of Trichoplax sp. H2]